MTPMRKSIETRAHDLRSRLENLDIGHPKAQKVSDRQKAFLVQFFRNFGEDRFSLDQIFEREFDEDLVERFGLGRLANGKLPRQDDLTVLTKHLAYGGLLEHLNGSRSFRLTEAGLDIARSSAEG